MQLNEYDTAPIFSSNQNMTNDCLFTFGFSPFLPEFTCFALKIVLNIKTEQLLRCFGLIEEKMDLSLIHKAV